MPYDPMDDLIDGDAPPAQDVTMAGEGPTRREGPAGTPPLPLIAGVAAVIVVVLAAVFLLGGAIGGGDAGPATTALPADAAAAGATPAVEAAPGADAGGATGPMPAFTGAIVLLVTPTFDGYEAVVTGGSRIGDVTTITVTVEDRAGAHAVEWYYPYKGESFVLMRGTYGGVAAQAERQIA